jgi:hypothetical protein
MVKKSFQILFVLFIVAIGLGSFTSANDVENEEQDNASSSPSL